SSFPYRQIGISLLSLKRRSGPPRLLAYFHVRSTTLESDGTGPSSMKRSAPVVKESDAWCTHPTTALSYTSIQSGIKYAVMPLALSVGIVTLVSTQGGTPVPTAAGSLLTKLEAPAWTLDSWADVKSRESMYAQMRLHSAS